MFGVRTPAMSDQIGTGLPPDQVDHMKAQLPRRRVEIGQGNPVPQFEHMAMLVERGLGAFQQFGIGLRRQRPGRNRPGRRRKCGAGQRLAQRSGSPGTVGKKRKSQPA